MIPTEIVQEASLKEIQTLLKFRRARLAKLKQERYEGIKQLCLQAHIKIVQREIWKLERQLTKTKRQENKG